MAQYIQQRQSGFYLRYAIPSTYRHALGLRELKYALRTHKKSVAQRTAVVVVGSIERYLAEIMSNEKLMADLTQEQLQQLVRRYVRDTIDEIEEARLTASRPLTAHEARERIQAIDLLTSDLREELGAGDFSRTEETAEYLLETHGLTADTYSLGFRKLCSELAHANVDLLRAEQEALRGKPLRIPSQHQDLAAFPTTRPASPQPPTGPKLSEVLEDLFAEKRGAGKFSDSEVTEYRDSVKLALFVLGDKPVSSYKYADGVTLRDTALRLPSSRNKRKAYRDLSLNELLEMSIPDDHLLSPVSVQKRLGYLKRIFDWLKKRGLADANPFEVELKALKKARPGFSRKDLQALFSSRLYHEVSYSNKAGQRAQWWLLPLALYTGARMGELIQLTVEDVAVVDGIYYLKIRDDGDKKVKTSSALRDVPVHPVLISLGFPEYLEDLKSRSSSDGKPLRLLPNLRLSKGQGSSITNKVSEWFRNYVDSHVDLDPIPDKKKFREKSFHSFRHTAITEARNKGMSERHLKFVIGHSSTNDNSVTSLYDHGETNIRPYYESICLIDYAGLDLSHLSGQWKLKPF